MSTWDKAWQPPHEPWSNWWWSDNGIDVRPDCIHVGGHNTIVATTTSTMPRHMREDCACLMLNATNSYGRNFTDPDAAAREDRLGVALDLLAEAAEFCPDDDWVAMAEELLSKRRTAREHAAAGCPAKDTSD